MSHCVTCDLLRRRDEGQAPVWDSIHRTLYWDVVHCNNISLPGWLILIVRRHIAAVDEMTEEEAVEAGKLMRRVSLALKHHTGCTKTYIVQFAEAPGHHHVHFHIIPRLPNQSDDLTGPNIFKLLGVPAEERVEEVIMNHIALDIRRSLHET